MKTMHITKQSIKENLLVLGVFFGVLIPIRLAFYHYLSHYWIGAIGVSSVFYFSMFYLSYKGKLGKTGEILTRKITKRIKGKFGKVAIIVFLFFCYFYFLQLGGVYFYDNSIVNEFHSLDKKQNIHSLNDMVNQASKERIGILEIMVSIIIIITPNPLAFATNHVVNELSNNWFFSLFTVFMIEQIESFGIIIYLRYFKKTPGVVKP